jgi:N utilization substance protein A
MLDIKALKQSLDIIAEEKRIDKNRIIEAVELSLAAAYKKEYGEKDHVVKCVLNLDTGETEFFQVKTVVDESTVFIPKDEEDQKEEGDERPRYNEDKHMLVADAQLIRRGAVLGDEIVFPLENKEDFGRIAAQTAKQVIVQKFREAEKDSLVREFEGKENSIVVGTVQRVEKGITFVDLGRATAIMPKEEQIPGESFMPGSRIRAYLFSFDDGKSGLSLRLSRSHPRFLAELFRQEAPEIEAGQVEIKYVAREAGRRSKVAVLSHEEHIDPVGACVGARGVRINQISQELRGERIDIIEWSENPEDFIVDALSPAEVEGIELDEANKQATVYVREDQFSLAIGKQGQNVRLAAKLTMWKIDIVKEGEESKKKSDMPEVVTVEEENN